METVFKVLITSLGWVNEVKVKDSILSDLLFAFIKKSS